MGPRLDHQPFLPTPLEIKDNILSFCDPQTLGRSAQSSLALLELASPYIYLDITINGFSQLDRLFSVKHKPFSPSLDPLLSLHRTRSLTFINLTHEQGGDPEWNTLFVPNRSVTPLHLDTLSVYFGENGIDGATDAISTSLLNLFDPEHVVFSISGVWPVDTAPGVALFPVNWTRLKSLTFKGSRAFKGNLAVCPFLADLAVGSLTILYTFSDDAEDEAWLYDDELLDDHVWMAADGRALSLLETPCVKEIVLRVYTQEQKSHVLAHCHRVWDDEGMSVMERKRREGLLRFDVVNQHKGEKQEEVAEVEEKQRRRCEGGLAGTVEGYGGE